MLRVLGFVSGFCPTYSEVQLVSTHELDLGSTKMHPPNLDYTRFRTQVRSFQLQLTPADPPLCHVLLASLDALSFQQWKHLDQQRLHHAENQYDGEGRIEAIKGELAELETAWKRWRQAANATDKEREYKKMAAHSRAIEAECETGFDEEPNPWHEIWDKSAKAKLLHTNPFLINHRYLDNFGYAAFKARLQYLELFKGDTPPCKALKAALETVPRRTWDQLTKVQPAGGNACSVAAAIMRVLHELDQKVKASQKLRRDMMSLEKREKKAQKKIRARFRATEQRLRDREMLCRREMEERDTTKAETTAAAQDAVHFYGTSSPHVVADEQIAIWGSQSHGFLQATAPLVLNIRQLMHWDTAASNYNLQTYTASQPLSNWFYHFTPQLE
ncbi:hypothetical protein JCM11641_006914, partial [Rhodosporidiobolus odoratus]